MRRRFFNSLVPALSLLAASAVAVRYGKGLSVGCDLKDLQPWLKGHAYKLDESFKDKILTPGFIESQGHPTANGRGFVATAGHSMIGSAIREAEWQRP